MTMPKSLRIGPTVYRVIAAPMKRKYGRCHFMSATITINDEMAETQTRDTLLHESLHAIAATASTTELVEGWSADMEEKLIRLWTPWLLGVIRDNPDLIAYLTE